MTALYLLEVGFSCLLNSLNFYFKELWWKYCQYLSKEVISGCINIWQFSFHHMTSVACQVFNYSKKAFSSVLLWCWLIWYYSWYSFLHVKFYGNHEYYRWPLLLVLNENKNDTISHKTCKFPEYLSKGRNDKKGLCSCTMFLKHLVLLLCVLWIWRLFRSIAKLCAMLL